jgi:hypothetical protein
MKEILYKASVVSILAVALIYVTAANGQNQSNVTAKVNMTASKGMANATAKVNMTSKAAGNATAGMNKTGSELAKNASAGVNKTELAKNASAGVNKTGSELAKNASQAGGQILNKTEDIGKKIAGGLGSLLGNASEKLKGSSK